ncbi:regulatory protein [Halospina denitrificans]|uniref:Regulatory protein RecX n=1 Tax=Halospina denitrificans TaxID=332522 RepID=A0A4R7JLV1_9GAMM|nr:regulatory protein RecX [Halospina denitrificans]TDT38644.1 regulatory protein [Halospina denitrificans]
MDTGDNDLENRALRLLARREHSRLELWHKLYRRAEDDAQLARVLEQLEAAGWLDDGRFAEVYARQRREAGYGPVRIRAELEQRGVTEVPEALSSVSEEEWQQAATRQRFRRFGDDASALSWKEMGRQGRFLAQRGFSRGQIEAALAASFDDCCEP